MNIAQLSVPKGLVEALGRRTYSYTLCLDLMNVIWVGGADYVGVFGDSAKAAYEWFIFNEETRHLETSNDGYGSASIEFLVALQKYHNEPVKSDDAQVKAGGA